MAADGSLIFDTGLDNSGFINGLNGIQSMAVVAAGNIAADIAQSVSSAMAAIPQQMVSIGAGFESSMSQVAATMGITDTAEEFGILTEAAKELGESTKYSAQQAGESLNYLALAGMNAEEAVSALPTVLNVAAAGGMELAAASDLITDAMSALGLELSDMNTFADELAVTAQKSNTSVEQLGEAILTVGGTAKTLSGGVAEMNTALGILADNGIKGAEGGTALRNVILSLSAPTDKAAEALANLGVNAFDEAGKMRPLQDTIADLDSALSAMSDQEKTAVLSEIFNKVDLKAVNALLGTSAERFDELSGYISDCEGAAAQMAETMDDNLNGDLTIMQSALEGLGIAAYEKFQEPMRTAVQSVTEDIGALTASLTDGELSESFDNISSALGESLESILSFAANDVIPAVISGMQFIAEYGEQIIGIAAGIGGAFLAWKVGEVVQGVVVSLQTANVSLALLSAESGAAAVQEMALAGSLNLSEIAVAAFTGQINIATVAMETLKKVIFEHPFGVLLAALAAVTAVALAAKSAIDNYTESMDVSHIDDQTKAIMDETESIKEQKREYDELIALKKEKEDADNAEINNIQRLWTELQSYVDESGNVISNNERASEIISMLNDNYDMNIGFIDDQIQGYQDLASSMDDYIEKLRIESRIRNGQEAYDEAVKNYDELIKKRDELEAQQNLYLETDKKLLSQGLDIQWGSQRGALAAEIASINELINAEEKAMNEYESLFDEKNKLADTSVPTGSGNGENNGGSSGNGTGGGNNEPPNEDELKEQWAALDHEYAMGVIASDTELYRRRRELLEQYGDESNSEHWSYYEKLHDMEQDFSDEQLKKEQEYNDKIIAETEKADKERAQEIAAAMDEQQDIVDNGLKDILKKYQDAYDEIEKKRQTYRDKLMSVGGELFSVETDENGKKSYIVNDIDEQLRKMREYDSAIRSLREQNASDALIAELTSMSDEDSYQFAEYLSGMSASEFGRINELYNEKQKLADELSKDMYANEAQAVSDAMTEELAGLVADSYDYGAMSAEQFALGFSEALNELKLGTVYEQLNAAGASRSYENYVIKDESGKDRTIKLDIDISGKSNVYLDNKKVGEQVTNYQRQTEHIQGE